MNAATVLLSACFAAWPGPADEKRVDQYGDPLPQGALARLGTVRFRPGGDVYRLGFSPNGRMITAQGLLGGTWVGEIPSGKTLRHLQEKQGYAVSFSYSVDGKTLATSGQNITLWDTASWRELRSFPSDNNSPVRLAPDGKSMSITDRILELDSGKEIRKFPGVIRQFSPDGKTLATWRYDNGYEFWDVARGKRHSQISGDPQCLAFSANSALVFLGVTNGAIHVYEVASGKRLRQWQAHPGWVKSLSLSPDGKILASGALRKPHEPGDPPLSEQEGIRLWDAANGKLLRQIDSRQGVNQVEFSPDGKLLAWSCHDGAIHLRELESDKLLSPVAAHTNWIVSLSFTQDGARLQSTGWDGTARLWESKSGKQFAVIEGPGNSGVGFRAALSADGATLVATAERDLAIWNAPSAQKRGALPLLPFRTSAIAFSPKRPLLAVGTYDSVRVESQVQFWDTMVGRQVGSLQDSPGEPTALAFSTDGKMLATVAYVPSSGPRSGRRPVRLWEVASGKEVIQLAGQRGGAKSVAFSPDGKLLAAGMESGTLRVWDVATGKQVRAIIAEQPSTGAIQFLPDNKTLVSTGISQAVHFWDVTTGEALGAFSSPQGLLMTLAVSSDGKFLATGSTDTTILVWDMAFVRKSLLKVGHGKPQ